MSSGILDKLPVYEISVKGIRERFVILQKNKCSEEKHLFYIIFKKHGKKDKRISMKNQASNFEQYLLYFKSDDISTIQHLDIDDQ